ncbi:MAG: EAL domain-containing protein [Burkholderiales bacterium]|nr:EAL domain-containing protein [Burkholderiales bacterium]
MPLPNNGSILQTKVGIGAVGHMRPASPIINCFGIFRSAGPGVRQTGDPRSNMFALPFKRLTALMIPKLLGLALVLGCAYIDRVHLIAPVPIRLTEVALLAILLLDRLDRLWPLLGLLIPALTTLDPAPASVALPHALLQVGAPLLVSRVFSARPYRIHTMGNMMGLWLGLICYLPALLTLGEWGSGSVAPGTLHTVFLATAIGGLGLGSAALSLHQLRYRWRRHEVGFALLVLLMALVGTRVSPASLWLFIAISIYASLRLNLGFTCLAVVTALCAATWNLEHGQGAVYHLARDWPTRVLLFQFVTAILVGASIINAVLVEERRRILRRTRESEASFQRLFDETPMIIIAVSETGLIAAVNRFGLQLLGCAAHELVGQPVDTLYAADAVQPVRDLLGHVGQHDAIRRETSLRSPDGRTLPVREHLSLDATANGSARLIIAAESLVEVRQLEQKLEHEHFHDLLTGIPNRYAMETWARRCIAQVSDSQRLEVGVVRLDRFRLIANAWGSAASDAYLIALSRHLLGQMRAGVALFKLNAQEFGFISLQASDESTASAGRLLQSAISAFRFDWAGETFTFTASIGVVRVDSQEANAAEALDNAAATCVVARSKGTNTYLSLESSLPDISSELDGMRWAPRILHAVRENRLLLYSQRIASVATDGSGDYHHEILIRMQGPGQTIIPPGQFLPIAERYNLAPDIDNWIVRHTFHWLATHRDTLRDIRLATSINLSGLSLNREDLQDSIVAMTHEFGIDPRSICFEITETAAIASLAQAGDTLRGLRAHGFRFALDDFGSGMSSFAYLRELPVDFVKIDGSFVRDISSNPVSEQFVRAIHMISQTLGKRTIAEFVEDSTILGKLAQIGIDYAQGFHIARPAPLDSLLVLASSTAQT